MRSRRPGPIRCHLRGSAVDVQCLQREGQATLGRTSLRRDVARRHQGAAGARTGRRRLRAFPLGRMAGAAGRARSHQSVGLRIQDRSLHLGEAESVRRGPPLGHGLLDSVQCGDLPARHPGQAKTAGDGRAPGHREVPSPSTAKSPREARHRIERLLAGPYLELFARRPAPGWTTWGNEVAKFDSMLHVRIPSPFRILNPRRRAAPSGTRRGLDPMQGRTDDLACAWWPERIPISCFLPR